MDGPSAAYLDAMGIARWRLRRAKEPLDEAGPTGPPTKALDTSSLDWDALRERVLGCRSCELHRGRTQAVFGVGDPCARLMIIGEAPGADEDRLGEPFVGRAGQLLTAMLAALGLERSQVYIANILKCRPPNNRDPKPQEAEQCTPYLRRQLELVSPKVVLAVGRIAAQWLLETDAPLGRLRGRVHSFGPDATPLVVSYHPAYLLRSPLQKRKSWEDLQRVRQLMMEN